MKKIFGGHCESDERITTTFLKVTNKEASLGDEGTIRCFEGWVEKKRYRGNTEDSARMWGIEAESQLCGTDHSLESLETSGET